MIVPFRKISPQHFSFNLLIPTDTITNKNIKQSSSITSPPSQDDNSFTCTTEERRKKLPFDDEITTVKEENHTRIFFQNVNSLKISTRQ